MIQTHDIPDPDAIASAFGLQRLLSRMGLASRIVHEREFAKVDARRMVELLGVELSIASEVLDCGKGDAVVIVDAQAGNSNIADLDCKVAAVIDHHPTATRSDCPYVDIRPEVGACSSIIADYYAEAGLEPEPDAATALYYGILIDTDFMTRGVSPLDASKFCWLSRFVEMETIRKLRSSQITLADLSAYAEAFRTVRSRGRVGFARLEGADASLVGSASDIVLSVDEFDVAVAYSERDDGVRISVRSSDPAIPADGLVRAVVAGLGFGGGHPHMAGGLIPAEALPYVASGRGRTLILPAGELIEERVAAYVEAIGPDSPAR